MAQAGKIATKAAVAAAIVGGGAFVGASHAGAQEAPAPAPTNPFEEWGQQLLIDAAPKVIEFVESLRPADNPDTAEITVGRDGATATGYLKSPWVFGQTEATPNGARVTVLRHGERDLLTKEGDENGGTWGGEWAVLGQGIDWVNERTCPSGGHGGEALCITFFEARATVDVAEEGEPVELTRTTHQIIDASGLSSTVRSILKGVIPNGEIKLTGTADASSAQHDATFSLFKASQGADSLALFPSASSWSSFELSDATLTTPPLSGNVFGTPVTIPPQTINISGLPRTCASESSAAVIGGSGIFGELADFFGTPKSGIWGDLGLSGGSGNTDCELLPSGN